MSATPATDCTRRNSTVISAWCRLSEADHPASNKKSGPYGAGVFSHRLSTPLTYGPEPRVPGP